MLKNSLDLCPKHPKSNSIIAGKIPIKDSVQPLNKSSDRYIPSEKDKCKAFGCFKVRDDLSDS
jgi:hypothetical protein